MHTTIFIPLSGRIICWKHLSYFLERQKINKNLFFLCLLDTSENENFHATVKLWLKNSKYKNYRLEKKRFSETLNLSSVPRMKNFVEVNNTMCKIYNYAKQIIHGEYIFIIEDDVIPPWNAYILLKNNLSKDVVSVSGAYKIRGQKNMWVAWDDLKKPVLKNRGKGVQQVASTGFGCVLFKKNDFVNSEISWEFKDSIWPWGYDMEFFSKQIKKVLINWDVYCQHLDETSLKKNNIENLKI